ncbi:hypothetical protein SASPL_100593 [Salvia splendens]|uniref:DUF4378 domain-containing protein n=1 Tax=Salvia splendens TaxID=180675 RepID=A0A8X9ABQ4_SALSN|nr:uncharacterized protein LOC121794491 [Salvia splendens]KAG6435718.1 hypothetical protein SASPL_100593 [Salvia splendens]
MAFQQSFAPLEHRPMLLKDFLKDDTTSSSVSNKSTAISARSNKPHIVLLRSWSRRAAATKISAVHKVIKLLQFASSKSPASVLPRKLTGGKRVKADDSDIVVSVPEVKVKVKVKDILRWRSFRDLAEDEPKPLDFHPSPHRHATSSATTTTTSCSKRSSWCDSDFTAEELSPWGGENEEFSTFKNPKGDWSSFEEYEQQSPVSVLDSPFLQVPKFTHFHPILENVQSVDSKCSLTQTTQERSTLKGEIAIYEEKARQLLSQVEEDEERHADEVEVLLDFFVDELSRNGRLNDDEFVSELLRITKSWMCGELEEERDSFVKEMERGFCWKKFEEEKEELCEELEVRVLNCLLDDLVAQFLC